jgi:hypothetical protein
MKKSLLIIIAILAFTASLTMYFIGKDSSHLSELYDLFWIPLPLGILSLIAALRSKK